MMASNDTTLSPISSTLPVRESVSLGRDERVKVEPKTSPPYNWICFLEIESTSGQRYVGSGFKIQLPDVDRTVVVTSGHCTFVNGAYAARITVKFPGKLAVEAGPDDLYASPEYRKYRSPDHDYGFIFLENTRGPGNGFGWSAIVSDEELKNRIVTNCGYPGDKERETLWITGGEITSLTANRIFYMNDTMGGQSGSPVYTWHRGYWTVIGVYSSWGCPISAPRLTVKMISRLLARANAVKSKSLRSTQFRNVYLRCDGTGVTRTKPSGGGVVNCQYQPYQSPTSYELFHILPVEIAPYNKIQVVTIESAAFKNVYIRMDGEDMSDFEESGGGEVNCQFNAGLHERFFLERSDEVISFRSVKFPNLYLRLDGSGVDLPAPNGSGTVNCQWYYTSKEQGDGSYETFHVEEH